MPDRESEELEDVDLATAAEQSSEEDEAQEGDVLAAEIASDEPAEERAMHVVGDGVDVEADLEAALDAVQAIGGSADGDSADGDSAVGDSAEGSDEAEDSAEDEVDPYAEFRAELKAKLGKWYVIHSYAGFEKRVKSNIENRRVSMAMEDDVYEVQ
ncbi:MAG: transcription termination/antitermination protein NusG, partial [Terrimesophilobacter sp.]